MQQQVRRRRPQQLHDAGQLLRLVLAREQGVARMEFRKDASWDQTLLKCLVNFKKKAKQVLLLVNVMKREKDGPVYRFTSKLSKLC